MPEQAREADHADLAAVSRQWLELIGGARFTSIDIPSERVTVIDPPPATIDNGPERPRTQGQINHAKHRQDREEFREALFERARPRPALGQFTITDLDDEVCHFPLGDGPYLFCGRPTTIAPYCASCSRIAYR